MLHSIFLLVTGLLGLGFLWLFLKYKHRYIGTDNRHKLFAEYIKDFPIFYNAKTMPMKKKLFESLEDLRKGGKYLRVLEIGVGPGANLQFYPENTKLTVVDPNPYFKTQLTENIKKYPNVNLDRYVVSGAENMKDIPDNSVDAVISTLVLCSCDHVQQVYKEICRVLTPLHFGFRLGIFQFLFDGCRPDKDLETELRQGGFSAVDSKRFRLDLSEGVALAFISVYAIIPHLFGTATAP